MLVRCLVLAILVFPGAVRAGELRSLSDSLDGWTVLAGDWNAADGVISGTAAPGAEAWLLHGGFLNDAEIEFEFRTPVPTNGGLSLRSHWLPRVPLQPGETAADAPRRMHGYHVNIETRQRLATGRLVDENGRGPLAEPSPEAAKSLSQKDWNRVRIVARGPVIEVYLGDALANRTEDEAYLGGHLALQVFAFEMKEAAVVEYRNLRVKDLGREGNWKALFDGQSLAGWKEWGAEEWSVEDGAIVGRSGPKKSEGYLATERTWTDFRVRGAFNMLGDGNFGLFYHSTITPKEDGYPVIAGVQGEVEPSYPSATGWLYESYKRGWLVKPDANTPAAMALRPGEWNEIEIRSQGKRVTTWVNGVRAVDFDDPQPNLTEGSFALQLHTGGVDGVAWKDLFVLE